MESAPHPTFLRDKALLALEEAIQECRYRTPRPSFAVRFALAYLWIYSKGDRQPFEELWKCLRAEKSPWSFSNADQALFRVYSALDLARPEHIAWDMWKRWEQRERPPTPAQSSSASESSNASSTSTPR